MDRVADDGQRRQHVAGRVTVLLARRDGVAVAAGTHVMDRIALDRDAVAVLADRDGVVKATTAGPTAKISSASMVGAVNVFAVSA